jgi:hypothetical protein
MFFFSQSKSPAKGKEASRVSDVRSVNDGFEDYANRCGAEQEPAEDLVLSRLMMEDG